MLLPLTKKSILPALGALLFIPGMVFPGGQLHRAAYNGDIITVRSLLQKPIDPDERDSSGGTALHAAMFQDNPEIIELLIEAGFDLNAQGHSNGYTPLHDAVWANNLENVRLLVQHGANITMKSKEGVTPYEQAVQENKTPLAVYLHGLTIHKLMDYNDKE